MAGSLNPFGPSGALRTNGNAFLQATVGMTGAAKIVNPVSLGVTTTGSTLTLIGGQAIEFGGNVTQTDADSTLNASNTGGAIFSGSTFVFGGGSTTVRNLTIGGNANTTITNTITNNSTATTGSTTLIKDGSGTLTLNPTTGNNALNPAGAPGALNALTVNAGTLAATNKTAVANQYGSGALTLGGGTLSFSKADATVATQTYTGTALTANTSSTLSQSSAGGGTDLLTSTGTITRNAASTLAFNFTGTQSATNNINVGSTTLGNWAIVILNSTRNFAAKDGSNIIAVTTTNRSVTNFGGSTTENATDTGLLVWSLRQHHRRRRREQCALCLYGGGVKHRHLFREYPQPHRRCQHRRRHPGRHRRRGECSLHHRRRAHFQRG